MDLGSLFLIFAVVVLVGLFVSRPFLDQRLRSSRRAKTSVDEAEHRRSSLLAERDRILTALQELDFDHALGKIPEEEYPAQRAAYLHQGAEVLRELDTFQPNKASAPAAEDRLEAAIAARRADAG